MERQTDRQLLTDRSALDRYKRRQTDRQAGRQAGRQTGERAGRQAGRQTERERERNSKPLDMDRNPEHLQPTDMYYCIALQRHLFLLKARISIHNPSYPMQHAYEQCLFRADSYDI